MIRLTATRNLNDLTITASVELADGAPDIPGKLRALLDQVAAVTPKPSGNGHAQPPAGQQSAHAGPANGNGHDAPATPRQVGFLNSLRARAGMRSADLQARIQEICGPGATLKSLSKDQASAVIEALKAENPPAKAE